MANPDGPAPSSGSTGEVAATDPLSRYSADVEAAMRRTVDLLPDSLLRTMVRYHLGWVDASGQPGRAAKGKGLRPALCLVTCAAAGGRPATAIGAAAAIELLHNFSLVHDDIQDQSPERHHRPAVWTIWGEAQAINAGDALFALAHLAPTLPENGCLPAAMLAMVLAQLDRCCLRLVTGQTLDLVQQRQADASAEQYFTMIGGKTAALIGASCAIGALVAGAEERRASVFERFGVLAGLAFQIVDDVLGIWGEQAATGKPQADDVYKQKITLPVVLAMRDAPGPSSARLRGIYSGAVVTPEDVADAIEILDQVDARGQVEAEANRLLAEALETLEAAAPRGDDLSALAHRLVARRA